MARRRGKGIVLPARDGWTYELELDIPGKRYKLTPGPEFKVRGERAAKFRFKEAVTTEYGDTWVTCYGGANGYGASRSFPIDQITWVSKNLPRK